MEREGKEPEWPPFDGPKYLLNFFWEIGPTMPGGMGPAPLSHGELEAWQRNIGIRLNPWECRTLRRLSVDYIAESRRATKRNCPSPWNPAATSIEHKLEVADDMMNFFRQMAAE